VGTDGRLEDVVVCVPVDLATYDPRQTRRTPEVGLQRDGSETVATDGKLKGPDRRQGGAANLSR
jgi:hypothetical protein